MKVILGLGNPEPRYDGTRHNIGFWFVDRLAGNASWKSSSKFQSLTAEVTMADQKVLLVKPQTYYNQVGQSARAVADFYKLPSHNILVVHDDLALPVGTLRLREKGSDGGNNGIKSLNAHLGPEYARLRIGIANQQQSSRDNANFVLSKLSQSELDTLETIETQMRDIVEKFVADKHLTTTYTHRAD